MTILSNIGCGIISSLIATGIIFIIKKLIIKIKNRHWAE